MDLGASTTFVAEPSEEDVMARPPRDPHRPFMDRGMQLGILAGGLSLAAVVLAPYLWVSARGIWSRRRPPHIWRGCWDTWSWRRTCEPSTKPLLRTSPFANRPFPIWLIATVALVGLGLGVPFLGARLTWPV
jgi:Ca2+-transporting ATPase